MNLGTKSIKRKKNTNEQRFLKASDYATRVTEDKTKKQDKRKERSHHRNGKGCHKQNTGRNSDDREPRDIRGKSCRPCRVCSETTHSNLFGCPNLQKYLLGQPGGSTSLPKEVCPKCLGHYAMKNYQKYFCKIEIKHFVFCKGRYHENAQDWMRVNYDPCIGLRNIDIMYDEIGANHIQINSIRVKMVHNHSRDTE